MNKFTANEVHEMASTLLHNPKPREWKARAGKMLVELANRMEADESVVPDDTWPRLELWFFRELTSAQRLSLFALHGLRAMKSARATSTKNACCAAFSPPARAQKESEMTGMIDSDMPTSELGKRAVKESDMDERMTLEQVRDSLYAIHDDERPAPMRKEARAWASVINAHLAQPAQAAQVEE